MSQSEEKEKRLIVQVYDRAVSHSWFGNRAGCERKRRRILPDWKNE